MSFRGVNPPVSKSWVPRRKTRGSLKRYSVRNTEKDRPSLVPPLIWSAEAAKNGLPKGELERTQGKKWGLRNAGRNPPNNLFNVPELGMKWKAVRRLAKQSGERNP